MFYSISKTRTRPSFKSITLYYGQCSHSIYTVKCCANSSPPPPFSQLEPKMIEVICNDRLGKKVRVKCKYPLPGTMRITVCDVFFSLVCSVVLPATPSAPTAQWFIEARTEKKILGLVECKTKNRSNPPNSASVICYNILSVIPTNHSPGLLYGSVLFSIKSL